MVISATGSEIIERLELGSVFSSIKTNPAIQFKQKKGTNRGLIFTVKIGPDLFI